MKTVPFTFWYRGQDQRSFKNFRVLTVTTEPARAKVLRQLAVPVGRAPKGESWRWLMFTDFSRFSLEKPERVLGPIWQYPDSRDQVGLL